MNNGDIPTVVSKYKSPYTIYIGRGSVLGNPYTVQKYGRDGCIEEYRKLMLRRLEEDRVKWIAIIRDLKGHTLGCFCKPKACHGGILVELYNDVEAGVYD